AINTFLRPEHHRVLLIANGAYAERMEAMLRRRGIPVSTLRAPVGRRPSTEAVAAAVRREAGLTHLAFVHVETTSGILNPLPEWLALAARHGLGSLVDSMSGFGAVPVDAAAEGVDVLIASGNKALEAPPGVAFAVVRRDRLLAPPADAPVSWVLDLVDQWRCLRDSGEWRATPPTHVVQAFVAALDLLRGEGGVAARARRYAAVRDRLIADLAPFGLVPLVDAAERAPVCVAFQAPGLIDTAATFARFHRHLAAAGLSIYARFHDETRSFRIGCMGAIRDRDLDDLVEAVAGFAADAAADTDADGDDDPRAGAAPDPVNPPGVAAVGGAFRQPQGVQP
ncbi:MAG: aminotransferase class V-fold PLP-dependent enzyme, partial [Alphaproteobacteria bacterium]|nr:aminotransferase class V-fold PLP-dependent enzyme [Alphaproteobacteria bacterium]